MLTGLRVTNWFTLADFTLRPGRFGVLDPAPGIDPTDPFDLVEILGCFLLEGREAERMFPQRSVTPSSRPTHHQNFELELTGPAGVADYSLHIEQHLRRGHGCRVADEMLSHDQLPAVAYNHGELLIDLEDSDPPDYPLLVSRWRSAIGDILDRPDPPLHAFRELLGTLHTLHVDLEPPQRVPEPTLEPRPDLSDLEAWILGLQARSPATVEAIAHDLAAQLVPLDDPDLEPLRPLCADPLRASLADILAPRARAVLALHTVHHALLRPDTTVCLRLPDVLTPAELEPWIARSLERTLATPGCQLLLCTGQRAVIDSVAAFHRLPLTNRIKQPAPPRGEKATSERGRG